MAKADAVDHECFVAVQGNTFAAAEGKSIADTTAAIG